MSAETGQLAADALHPRSSGWPRAVKVALPFLLLAVLFASPFYFVWIRWTDTEDYYTHGPLIPFVSAYLVLRKRKELTGEDPPDTGALYAGGVGALVLYFVFNDMGWDKRWLFALLCAASAAYMVHAFRNLKPEPWKPGLFLFVPSLVLCVVAAVHQIVSLGWFFSVLVVIGLVVYYLGKRAARVMAFPLIFLFSSVPMPEYIVQRTTMPLKKFATANTVRLLNSRLVGIYCEREGASIHFPPRTLEEIKAGKERKLTVGAVCSGLRSLIALVSFGLLFAYITPLSLTKKILLFLAVIPASFIANLARILTLALVSYYWDVKAATGDLLWDAMEKGPLSSMVPHLRKISNEPVHDFSGIMIFLIAFVALFAFERFLIWIERRQRLRAAAAGAAPAGPEDADA